MPAEVLIVVILIGILATPAFAGLSAGELENSRDGLSG